MNSRPEFGRYRERLAALGFSPSRSRGQNFLLDPSLHRAIVEAAGIQPDDVVVEIGAGLGFLTRELAPRARCVISAELDPRLLKILEEDRPSWGPCGARVRFYQLDALERGAWHKDLVAACEAALVEHPGRLVWVANLPYAVAGPLLAAAVQLPTPPAAAAVMVQWEMAERVRAAPGSSEYGSLSVLVQSMYEVRIERRVAPEVFRPRPAVASAVLALRRRPGEPGLPVGAVAGLSWAQFVRSVFGHRRKQIRGLLERLLPASSGERLGGLPVAWLEARPQDLSWRDYLELFARLEPRLDREEL